MTTNPVPETRTPVDSWLSSTTFGTVHEGGRGTVHFFHTTEYRTERFQVGRYVFGSQCLSIVNIPVGLKFSLFMLGWYTSVSPLDIHKHFSGSRVVGKELGGSEPCYRPESPFPWRRLQRQPNRRTEWRNFYEDGRISRLPIMFYSSI